MKPRCTALCLFAGIAIGAGSARAADPAPPPEASIKYRQALMSAIGGDMAAIGNILKYGLPLRQNIATHAENIERSAALIPSAFETKVVDGLTDAKPAIWEKPADFKKKAEAMRDQAKKLAELAKAGDPEAVGKQMKALGGACGDCHDDYRKPKEESYKRRAGGGGD